MEELPMSLKPKEIADIPEETKRIAKRAFPKGNIYMQMRDELGTLYEGAEFAALFPSRGQPAYSPWRLALVCVMQYVANLSDRQAAEAALVWERSFSFCLGHYTFKVHWHASASFALVSRLHKRIDLQRLLRLDWYYTCAKILYDFH